MSNAAIELSKAIRRKMGGEVIAKSAYHLYSLDGHDLISETFYCRGCADQEAEAAEVELGEAVLVFPILKKPSLTDLIKANGDNQCPGCQARLVYNIHQDEIADEVARIAKASPGSDEERLSWLYRAKKAIDAMKFKVHDRDMIPLLVIVSSQAERLLDGSLEEDAPAAPARCVRKL